MSREKEALDAIRYEVRTGMYDAEEIHEIVTEGYFQPGEIDPDWLRAEIDRAIEAKVREEETWPEVTDCDRLDAVMDAFWEEGILALQDAGYTQQDGICDVRHFYHENGGEDSDFVGYCFYTSQDLKRAVENGTLYLTFGDLDNVEGPTVEIGRRIRQAFESAGFAVEWDGTAGSRILVQGIRWLRRTE